MTPSSRSKETYIREKDTKAAPLNTPLVNKVYRDRAATTDRFKLSILQYFILIVICSLALYTLLKFPTPVNPSKAGSKVEGFMMGEIHLRRAERSLPSIVALDVSTSRWWFSKATVDESAVLTHNEDEVLIDMLAARRGSSATVWISAGAKLELLKIDASHFNVNFDADLDLDTASTIVTTTSGSVSAHFKGMPLNFKSREITIVTNSNTVTGSFPLYDKLDIRSNSGSIDIDVSPQEVGDVVQPADLILSSQSGSVNSRLSTVGVPNRNYTNTIASNSGSIDTVVLHGNATTIRTNSGSITADIHPYGFNGTRTFIDTRTTGGRLDLTVNPSLSHPEQAIEHLSTNHKTSSGSQNVFYPGTWQGTVEASSVSGSVDVQWTDFRVTEDQRGGGVNRRLKGIRIAEGGYMGLVSNSGSVTVRGQSK